MSLPKIIISHPTGNENVRAVLTGLEEAGLLGKFYTTLALFKNSWVGKLAYNFGPADIKRRFYMDAIRDQTICQPFFELGRLVSQKFGWRRLMHHETGQFSIDHVYRHLDQFAASKLQGAAGVYAYEDGALTTFKAAKDKGLTCFFDEPIGYWRCMRELLQEERENRPAWASTLTGFMDSDAKLQRKDEELALADYILVASNFTKRTLSFYPGPLAPVKCIPYGFPTPNLERTYTRGKNDKLKCLFVGSLSQRKGVANIIEAIKGLEAYVALTFVGQKVTDDCLLLNEALHAHRWIPSLSHADILKEMADSDVLLFPSLFEGFGLVVTEAMSQGTPVITTDRTCGPDIIRHGRNGWLVEAGNSMSLKACLEMLIADRTLAPEVGQAALQTATARSWTHYGRDVAHFLLQNMH